MRINFDHDHDYVLWPSLTAGPFTVTMSAACSGQYEIELCSHCSKSYFHGTVADQNNLHLIPRWRFLNSDREIVTTIPVEYETMSPSGVSGSITFYYVDDMPSVPSPVYLQAEIKNISCPLTGDCCDPSYTYTNLDGITAKSIDTIPVWINEWMPRKIRYTRNGIDNINDKWATLPIGWTATLHDTVPNVPDWCEESPIIFSYATLPNSGISVETLTNTTDSYCCPTSSQFVAFDKTEHYGWAKGQCTTKEIDSAIQSTISGSMFVEHTAARVYQAPWVYTSNPAAGKMTVIRRDPAILDIPTFYKQPITTICNNSSYDAFEALSGAGAIWSNYTFDVPIVTAYNDPMALTGFAGIYGMAVARNYCPNNSWEYVWAADAELDRVYKISTQGDILKTINFEIFSFLPLVTAQCYCGESGTLEETLDIDVCNQAVSASWPYCYTFDPLSAAGLHLTVNITPTGVYWPLFETLDTFVILSTCNESTEQFEIYSKQNITTTVIPSSQIVQEFLFYPQFTEETKLNITIALVGNTYSQAGAFQISSLAIPSEEIFDFGVEYLKVKYANLEGITPASIALDKNYNFWVTTFDSNKVYKFDKDGNWILTLQEGFDILPYPEQQEPIGIDNIYKPAVVETDVDDNIWVAYNNTESSFLYKYDTNGGFLLSASEFSPSSTPVDLLVDGCDNSVWVSMAFTHYNSFGEIRKFDTSGTLVSAFTGLYIPSNITIDKERRLWYTYDHDSVAYIDLTGGQGTINTLTNMVTAPWQYRPLPDYVNHEQNLEGIAVDQKNILWVLDSKNNIGYGLNLNLLDHPTLSGFVWFNILPHTNYAWYNDSISGQYVGTDDYYKSAQAFGDWTGYRWYQKYFCSLDTNTLSATITGESNTFNIRPFEAPFEFRKFNESWDVTTQVKEYAMAPHINSFYNLWNGFFEGSVGGLEPGQQLGRKVYEGIANFVPYHEDIDESNIRKLYSIAQKLDVPIDNYDLSYPPEIRRIVNLGSINHSKLWGEYIKCNLNITNEDICPRCGYKHSNLGDIIEDPLTYMLTAGSPFIRHNNFMTSQYAWEIFYPSLSTDQNNTSHDLCSTETSTILSGISTYPLSSYLDVSIDGFDGYDFYEYKNGFPYLIPCTPPAVDRPQAAGVINWNDDYTTLNRDNSSVNYWYSLTGGLQMMLEYNLLKGLQISGTECDLS